MNINKKSSTIHRNKKNAKSHEIVFLLVDFQLFQSVNSHAEHTYAGGYFFAFGHIIYPHNPFHRIPSLSAQ